MGIFSQIGQALRGLGQRISNAVKGARERIQSARNKPPVPPKGYQPETPDVTKLPPEPPKPPKSPGAKPPKSPASEPPSKTPDTDSFYDDAREYRSHLVELAEYFDFPSSVVEQLANIDLDSIYSPDSNILRLNMNFIDKLEEYREAYAMGRYIPEYDYYVNEINMALSGVEITFDPEDTSYPEWLDGALYRDLLEQEGLY